MLKDKKMVRRLALLLCLALLVGLVPSGILSVPFGVNATDAPVNVLANGSFENGKEGWNGSAEIEVADAEASDGAYAAVIPADDASFFLKSDRVAVVPGETYHLSAMAKRLSGDKTAYIGFWYVDAAGAYVGDGAVAVRITADEWSEYTMDWTAPAGVAYFWIELGVNSKANSSFAIDDIVVTKTSGTPEQGGPEETLPGTGEPVVIVDDGFENGTDGWKNVIVAEGAGKTGNAMQICIDNSGKDIETANASRIPVAAGQKYTLTFYAKRDASDESDKGATAYLIWYDAAGQLNNPNGTDLNDNNTQKWHAKVAVMPEGEWTKYELEAVVPEGAATMAVRFYVAKNMSLNLYVDDVQLVQQPTAAPEATEPEDTTPVGEIIFSDKFETFELFDKNRLPVGWTSYSPENIRVGVAKDKDWVGGTLNDNYFFAVQDLGDKWGRSPLYPVTPGYKYTANFMETLMVASTTAGGGYVKLVFVDEAGNVLTSKAQAITTAKTWSEKSVVAQAPAGAVNGYVEFGIAGGSGNPSFAIDDLNVYEAEGQLDPDATVPTTPDSTTPSVPSESGTVLNGGFEDGLNNWNVIDPMSHWTEDKHSGEASLKYEILEKQGGRYVKQVVSAVPGKTYTLSAWVKVLEGKGGYIGLYGIDGANKQIGFGEPGDWMKYSVTVTVPYGFNAVEVEFGTTSNTVVTFLLDDIELVEVEGVEPPPTEPEPTETIVPEGEKVFEDQFENAFTPEGAPGTCHLPVDWTASQHSAAIGTAKYDSKYNNTQNLCIQDAKDKWIKSPLVEVVPGYEYIVTYVEHKYVPTERGAGGYAVIVFVDADGNVLKEYRVEAGTSKYWTQKFIYSKAPEKATHFYVEFGLLSPSGEPTYSVDDLAVYAVEASLDDPDVTQPTEPTKPLDPMKPFEENFETPADDMDLNAGPLDWICNDDSAEAYGTMISLVNNSLSLDGNYLRLSKINTWTATSPEFPVEISYAYTVKFMARKLVDNTNFNGSVELVFVNTRGKIIETHTAVAGKTFGEWTEESLTAVAPIGAYRAYVVLRVENNGRKVNADFAVDNLSVVRAEAPSFDYEQDATEPIVYNPVVENAFGEAYTPEGAPSSCRLPVGWVASQNSAAIGIGNYDKYEGTSTLFMQNKGGKWIKSPTYDAKPGYGYLVSYVEKKYQPHIEATGGYMKIVFVDASGAIIAEYKEEAGVSKKWIEMEYEYVAPAGATGYYIEFGIGEDATGGDPTYGVDNLVVYESEDMVKEPSAPEQGGNGSTGNGGTGDGEDNSPTGDTAAIVTMSVVLAAIVAMAVLVLKKLRFF